MLVLAEAEAMARGDSGTGVRGVEHGQPAVQSVRWKRYRPPQEHSHDLRLISTSQGPELRIGLLGHGQPTGGTGLVRTRRAYDSARGGRPGARARGAGAPR